MQHLKKGIRDALMGVVFSMPLLCHASLADTLLLPVDSLPFGKRIVHQVNIEYQPAFVFRSNPFLKGINYANKKSGYGDSYHLKYAFRFRPESVFGRIYPGSYQGIGLSFSRFGLSDELGDPVSFYLFHGATIVSFAPRLSWNYEWNFGLSLGWKPYDPDTNDYNQMIGSRTNAYLNIGSYLSWKLSPLFDLHAGASLTHFSNGNTKFPNAGLNSAAFKLGLVYNFNRTTEPVGSQTVVIPPFRRHISYDLIFFGSWRKKGVYLGDERVAAPHTYGVGGFNFTPMCHFSYRFRAGFSLDGVFDASANLVTEDYISETMPDFYAPLLTKQLALGLSGRAEYVMPFFSINVGFGANVLHRGGDLKGFYQVLALKIDMSRNLFLHIGYNLQDFKNPNYLMLGFGFRFHSVKPKLF